MVTGSTAPAPPSLLDGLSAAPQPVPPAIPPMPLAAGAGTRTQASEAGPNEDMVSQLERLAKLRESGAITQFEFQAAKDKLLR
jgi:hypothetical protein